MSVIEGQYETGGLAPKLGVDVAAALTAALAVSPIMTAIDKAVVEAAATRGSVLASLQASAASVLRQPHIHATSRPFGVMMLLYGCTYTAANAIDTVHSHGAGVAPETTTSSSAKFLAVTAVNLNLSLYKDSCFARTFGADAARLRPMPPIAFVPLVVRDGITLFATFNLPAVVAPALPPSWERHVSRLSLAQMAAPALSQFAATPLHLLGLDLYYRHGHVPLRERMASIWKTWLPVSCARACRVIPAFGVGGVVNNESRAYLMRRLF